MIRAVQRNHLARQRRTYYVDATLGNDANNGRSPDAAWQTIGQVNAAALGPGDKVLFKRGETFNDEAIVPQGHWLTYADYGSGDKPIIDGGDTFNGVNATEVNGVRLKNLDFTQGLDFGAYFITCAYVYISECDFHDAGNDNLNFFDESHHCKVLNGLFYNVYRRVADGRQSSGIEIANGCHDIIIDGAECYDGVDNGMGIAIHSHSDTDMPYNITIRNVSCHDNVTSGLQIFKQDDVADTDLNILIEDSSFNGNTEDGVRYAKALAIGEYPIGITIDNCVMKDNTRYAFWAEGENFTLRKCTFHEGRMAFIRDFTNLVVYNCTFYLTTWGGYAPLTLENLNIVPDGAIIKNNIFASPDDGTYITWADPTTNVIYDYNIYDRPVDALSRWRWDSTLYNFTNWKTQCGGDSHSQYTSAGFTDAGNDDFTLTAESAAIDAGVDVGLSYLGSAPDCGANEKA